VSQEDRTEAAGLAKRFGFVEVPDAALESDFYYRGSEVCH